MDISMSLTTSDFVGEGLEGGETGVIISFLFFWGFYLFFYWVVVE